MLKKIESGRRFAREAYWSIVGIFSLSAAAKYQ